jgi:cell division protein FtsB
VRIIGFKRFEVLVSFGCLVLLGYFGWHGFYGTRGYPYRDHLQQQTVVLSRDLDAIALQRKTKETRVALMRPESLDPDLLDELARKDLDMVGKNDIVVEFQQ